MTRNTKASKALLTMRNLMARGIADRETLVGAACGALGGEDCDRLIAEMTWRKHFEIMAAN